MKALKRTLVLLSILALLLPAAAMAIEDGYSTSYTYTYDYWGDSQDSPDAYRVETVIDSITLGLDSFALVQLAWNGCLRPTGNGPGHRDCMGCALAENLSVKAIGSGYNSIVIDAGVRHLDILDCLLFCGLGRLAATIAGMSVEVG